MTLEKRQRPRVALQIHERLTEQSRQRQPPPAPPLDAWRELLAASRQLTAAQARGWSQAATLTQERYRRTATLIAERLSEQVRVLSITTPRPLIQSPREMLADLIALEAEFAEVELDLQQKTLALTTDPIALEGFDLGRFQIVLHWSELPESGAYDVVALDPNPAASEETTTHPHVRDEALCEGEGRIPIRRALQQGRLFDFALLVRGILTTYNAGSAYVPLSQWHGTSCSDCGYVSSEDESISCDRCSSDLCYDCSSSCGDCGRSCCADCRDRCARCDVHHCSACLTDCSDCDETCCQSCLSSGRCNGCREANEDDPDSITTPPEEPNHDTAQEPTTEKSSLQEESTDSPLHPLCLGETVVSA